jgi:hypothetical protein
LSKEKEILLYIQRKPLGDVDLTAMDVKNNALATYKVSFVREKI